MHYSQYQRQIEGMPPEELEAFDAAAVAKGLIQPGKENKFAELAEELREKRAERDVSEARKIVNSKKATRPSK